MSEKTADPGERWPNLGVLATDAALLDTLGRGEPAPTTDAVAAMLAAWRADLDADITGARYQPAAFPPRTRRLARRAVGVAAAAALLASGSVMAAGHATPASPLWPITRVMYPERADTAAAEDAIGQAREAAAHGRYDDARRLLDRAEGLIARVRDPKRLRQLQAELRSVRAMLPAAAPAAPGTRPPGGLATTPDAAPTPPTTQPTTQPTQPPTTAGGRPAEVPRPLIVPSTDAPPIPVPTPTGSLLSTPLPSLPVPGVTAR